MSATNRGAVRNEADFYATPLTAFTPLLPYLPRVVWEPACGDGRLVMAMLDFGISARGNDLKQGYDFLTDDEWRSGIVTNPPYSLALEFADHALKRCHDLFLLLRLNFLASKKRREWFREHEPSALFILSERPRFGPNKHGVLGSDATDYAWFYWAANGRDAKWNGIVHL